MKLGITRTQRANLKKLAAYLEGLPADYTHFGMSYFLRHNGREINVDELGAICAPCGTAACAVGHAPDAGISISAEDEDWTGYSERVFGLMAFTDNRWDWCFGGSWDRYDNSHYGAAARIQYLLKHGSAPKDFSPLSAEYWGSFIAEYAAFRKASGIEARSDETALAGSAEGESPVGNAETPQPIDIHNTSGGQDV